MCVEEGDGERENERDSKFIHVFKLVGRHNDIGR